MLEGRWSPRVHHPLHLPLECDSRLTAGVLRARVFSRVPIGPQNGSRRSCAPPMRALASGIGRVPRHAAEAFCEELRIAELATRAHLRAAPDWVQVASVHSIAERSLIVCSLLIEVDSRGHATAIVNQIPPKVHDRWVTRRNRSVAFSGETRILTRAGEAITIHLRSTRA